MELAGFLPQLTPPPPSIPGIFSSINSFQRDFVNPGLSARPKLRWWWPHGLVNNSEITNEIDQMLAAGFGGAEINDVHPSVSVEMDPVGHGWATTPWIDAVIAANERAKSTGFQLDIAPGPSWPASSPDVRPDDEAAAKEVVTGRIVVANGTTYSGGIPPPYSEPEPGVFNQTLLALQAWRVNAASVPTAATVVLDSETLVDLTKKIVKGKITWTPPDKGTWILLSYHMRGTAQLPEAGPHTDPEGSVIDHFSKAGSQATISYWEKNILSPKLRSLLRTVKGSIFEDSIEFEYSTLWTPLLPQEFKKRRGYDLFTVLPSIAQENQKRVFTFKDAELARGAVNDYWDTMGELYIENHARVIKKWAGSLGMKLRGQPFGLPTDAMSAAAELSIPEGESLGFKNLGDFRSLAGAANMAGLPLISNEAAAFANGAYSSTWQQVLRTLNPIFSVGVNHQVLHGFSYLSAPETQWPGFAAFSPYSGGIGYSESWGPRHPLWVHAPDVTGYISRMQFILQRGRPQHDVAFFSQKGYIGAGYDTPWFSADGVKQGWSLNVIGPALLRLPNGEVRDRRLAPNGPGFKVLAFEGDAFSSQASVMKLDSATRILQYAEKGLPVVVVGNWSVVSAYGRSEASQNKKITEIFSKLLRLRNVANVATRADIPTGVAALGLQPDVQYSSPSQMVNFHKVDGDLEHFVFVATPPTTFAYNPRTVVSAVEADVTLPRKFPNAVPVLLDLWTGEMTPIGLYKEISPYRIGLHISLQPYQAKMITLVRLGKLDYAVSTTAPNIYRKSEGLVLRSNVTGTFSTTLNTGRNIHTTVGDIPKAPNLTNWTLDVEDWQPGSTPTATKKTKVKLQLDSLKVWTEIPELVDVSGIGTYSTKFTLDKWPKDAGAILYIPTFLGSFRIKVNGKKLPPADQLAVEFDIGKWLKNGANTLEIEVATTLMNRLRTTRPEVFGIATRQAFGLVGPVRILPYRESVIAK